MNLHLAKKSLTAAMCAVLLSCIGISLPYPILAPYFINEVNPLTTFYGLPSKFLLGVVLAVYPLGVLIGSALIGAVSDIFGRKLMLQLTLFVSAIGYIGSAYAFIEQSFLMLIITRFITGFCEGNISVAKAIATDLSPTLDKTTTFSLINATPFLGGLLAPLGIANVFFIAVGITFIALFSISLLLPVEQPITNNHSSIYRIFSQQNSFVLLKNKSLLIVFSAYFLATLGLNAYYEFYPLFLTEQFEFTAKSIGLITVVVTSFMIISSIFVVKKIKRQIGLIKGSMLGLALLTVCLFIHNMIPEQWLWPFYGVFGFCIAIFNGFIPVYISEKFNHLGQGQLMGLVTTTFSLANVIMALVGSAIAIISTTWAITLGAVLCLLATLLFIKTQR